MFSVYLALVITNVLDGNVDGMGKFLGERCGWLPAAWEMWLGGIEG